MSKKDGKAGFFVDPEKAGDPVYRHCRQDSWVSLLNIQPLSLQKYKPTKHFYHILPSPSMFCQWWVSFNVFRIQGQCDLILMFIVRTCQIPNIVIFFSVTQMWLLKAVHVDFGHVWSRYILYIYKCLFRNCWYSCQYFGCVWSPYINFLWIVSIFRMLWLINRFHTY